MQIIQQDQSKQFANGSFCTAWEYLHQDKDLNLAIIDLSGPYPESGYAVNREVKELVYILEGRIVLILEDKEVELSVGDSVILEIKEKFAWRGSGKMAVFCAPAWNPEQYEYAN